MDQWAVSVCVNTGSTLNRGPDLMIDCQPGAIYGDQNAVTACCKSSVPPPAHKDREHDAGHGF